VNFNKSECVEECEDNKTPEGGYCPKKNCTFYSNVMLCEEQDGCIWVNDICVNSCYEREPNNDDCGSDCNFVNNMCKNCPIFEEYNNESKTCVFLNCSQRSPDNTTNEYPCGNNCYLSQSNYSVCVSSCDIYEDDNYGKCILKSCISKLANYSLNLPCGENCYVINGDPTKCSDSCRQFEIVTSGICENQTCEQRTPNNNETSPCGPGCFVSSTNTNECTSECKEHEIVEFGKCVIKVCTSRTPNITSSIPCGSECYVMSNSNNSKCVLTCNQFESDVNGKCVEQTCDQRNVQNSSCGSGCYISSSNSSICVNTCELFEETSNGTCVVQECGNRIPLNISINPCGNTCSLSNDFITCANSCGIFETNVNGICFLQTCGERTPINSTCGNGCFFNNGTCGSNCQPFQVINGSMCISQTCEERTPSPNVSISCGDGCYVSATSVLKCVDECETFENQLNGSCVIQECSLRIPQEGLSDMCGSDCMRITQNGTGICANLNCSIITNENECWVAPVDTSCQYYEQSCYRGDEPVGNAGVYYVSSNNTNFTLIACRNPNIRCGPLDSVISGFFESTSANINLLEGVYTISSFNYSVLTLMLNGSILASGYITTTLNIFLEQTDTAIFTLGANGYKITLFQV
jgi:hypothetical protein